MMQFRVRDLLLATALVAIYLTGYVYAIQGRENVFDIDRLGNIAGGITGMLVGIPFFAVSMRWFGRRARRKVRPIIASFSAPSPWPLMFFYAGFALAIAFVSRWVDGVFLWACWGASLPLIGYSVVAILDSTVYVSAHGIVYMHSLLPWSKVSPVFSVDGKLTHLRIGRSWPRVIAKVPAELREQIAELVLEQTRSNEIEY